MMIFSHHIRLLQVDYQPVWSGYRISRWLLPLLLCIWQQGNSQPGKQVMRPNIIVFMVDDMGWQDASVPFADSIPAEHRHFRTPNMEKLAARGATFTQAYATPVCSPSRVSLLTGMNAARHRVTNWTLRKNEATDATNSILAAPAWNVNGLSPIADIPATVHATPLPALLQKTGYYTIHCGKAHFGAMETPGANPLNLGFNINIAGHAAGGPGSFSGQENYGNKKNTHTLPWGVPGLESYHGTDVFLTEALTREAIRAMEVPVQNHQPFFLHMSHYAVHIPITGDPGFLQRYLQMGLSQKEAEYASMIEGMDKSLGDLMEFLEQKGILHQTILMFISDNGGFSMAPRSGAAFTHNTPLRAGKGSVYEGGIRVPMLVSWPGVTQEGSRPSNPVIIEDFFPTILEMAGVKHAKTIQTTDGKSFVPAIRGAAPDTTRALVWHFPNQWIQENGPGVNFKSAIRKGSWKMVYDYYTGKKELYLLNRDLSEQNDLAAAYPRQVNRLSKSLSRILIKRKAQLPVFRKNGQAAPLPNQIIP